uniref:Transposase n=1 Tax=Ascaris lumbricoides TaxID=6252 RepID=A0A0M3HGX0_ASCLU
MMAIVAETKMERVNAMATMRNHKISRLFWNTQRIMDNFLQMSF